ncbi:MAG: hypothetical protein GY950_29670 [bacterium]|nr:hypothetical protein [bacterium]
MEEIKMEEIKKIEKRLEKLEKQSFARFFIQYIFSPLLLIIIGALLNWQLEHKKSEIQKLQLAQEMVSTLFTVDAHRAFITQKLINKVLDKELSDEIAQTLEEYYKRKVEKYIEDEDFEAAEKIISAAESIYGELAKELKKVTKTEKAEEKIDKVKIASAKERKGFEYLLDGKYNEAIKAFDSAEKAYPTFHQVYEIARYLSKLKKEGILGAPGTRKLIFKKIISEYSWKAPKSLLNEMRRLAKDGG